MDTETRSRLIREKEITNANGPVDIAEFQKLDFNFPQGVVKSLDTGTLLFEVRGLGNGKVKLTLVGIKKNGKNIYFGRALEITEYKEHYMYEDDDTFYYHDISGKESLLKKFEEKTEDALFLIISGVIVPELIKTVVGPMDPKTIELDKVFSGVGTNSGSGDAMKQVDYLSSDANVNHIYQTIPTRKTFFDNYMPSILAGGVALLIYAIAYKYLTKKDDDYEEFLKRERQIKDTKIKMAKLQAKKNKAINEKENAEIVIKDVEAKTEREIEVEKALKERRKEILKARDQEAMSSKQRLEEIEKKRMLDSVTDSGTYSVGTVKIGKNLLDVGGKVASTGITTGGEIVKQGIVTTGDVAKTAIGGIGTAASNITGQVIRTGGDIIQKGGEVVGQTIQKGGEVVGQTIQKGGEVVGQTIQKGGEVVGQTIQKGGEVVGQTIQKGGEVVGQTIQSDIKAKSDVEKANIKAKSDVEKADIKAKSDVEKADIKAKSGVVKKGVIEKKPVEEKKGIIEKKPVEEKKGIIEKKPVEEKKGVIEKKPVEEKKGIIEKKPVEEKTSPREEVIELKEPSQVSIGENVEILDVLDEDEPQYDFADLLDNPDVKAVYHKMEAEKIVNDDVRRYRESLKDPNKPFDITNDNIRHIGDAISRDPKSGKAEIEDLLKKLNPEIDYQKPIYDELMRRKKFMDTFTIEKMGEDVQVNLLQDEIKRLSDVQKKSEDKMNEMKKYEEYLAKHAKQSKEKELEMKKINELREDEREKYYELINDMRAEYNDLYDHFMSKMENDNIELGKVQGEINTLILEKQERDDKIAKVNKLEKDIEEYRKQLSEIEKARESTVKTGRLYGTVHGFKKD